MMMKIMQTPNQMAKDVIKPTFYNASLVQIIFSPCII